MTNKGMTNGRIPSGTMNYITLRISTMLDLSFSSINVEIFSFILGVSIRKPNVSQLVKMHAMCCPTCRVMFLMRR